MTTLWAIHGGRDESVDPQFREKNQLALGWSAIKAALATAYPEKPAAALGSSVC